jgi:integrase
MSRVKMTDTIAVEFTGPLAGSLAAYIGFKRSGGNAYIAECAHYRRLDAFAKEFGCPANTLTRELVLAWIDKRPHEKRITQVKRINAIKRLGEYMLENGCEAYIFPYKSEPPDEPYIPYIFSEQEIASIFRQADIYRPTAGSPALGDIVPLVFRILYGCGLRTSEALNLRICDVDTDAGVLRIMSGKFGKSRLVPMSPSLSRRCAEHIKLSCFGRASVDCLIANPDGGMYNDQEIYYWFRNLLFRAGIPHRGKGKGPRVHDIRHTHAVHCLKKWALTGRDIHALLPVLSAYLGHCDLRGTQQYLRLTPDLFPVISETMDAFFANAGEVSHR